MSSDLASRARLHTTDLRRAGVFEDTYFRVAVEKDPSLAGEASIKVLYNAKQSFVKVELRDSKCSYSQDISVVEQRNGAAASMFFVCPGTNRRVRSLFFDLDGFYSRKCLRIRYDSQDRPKRRPKAGRVRAKVVPKWATEAALSARSLTLDADIRRLFIRFAAEGLRREGQNPVKQASLFPLPTTVPIATYEDHPLIDLRVLHRHGLVKPGRMQEAALTWGPAAPLPEANIFVDLTNPADPVMGVHWPRGEIQEGHEGHIVRLSRDSRGRYQFQCWGSDELCEVLAFRNGRFASRIGQRLRHQSQRSA